MILRIRPFTIYTSSSSISLFFIVFLLAPQSALSRIDENNIFIVLGIHDHHFYEFHEEGNNKLVATLDAGLQILNNGGKYSDIFEKWFGVYENNKNLLETRVRYFLISLFAVIFLFLGILMWTWSLRRQVKSRTAELELSEKRYRLLVENASEGVIVYQQKSSIYRSRALQILDCTKEELNTKTLFDIIHPDDQNVVLDFYFDTLMKEDVVLQYPFRIITGKDEPQWVLNNTVKIEWEKKTGVLNIFTDITESKKLEQQLLQAQKMEAIGQFAGGIAHDFNNILTAIMGYGNLVKMKIKGDESLVKYIDNILTSAEKAANLTKSLLTFTRKQVTDPKPTDVNEVILNAEKLLSKLIGEDIEFSVKLNSNSLIVIVDGNQIIQVLMNLATNARDAMPRGRKADHSYRYYRHRRHIHSGPRLWKKRIVRSYFF